MTNINWYKIIPHVGITLLFIVIAAIYCSPVFDGKVLSTHDDISWQYMSHEAREFNQDNDSPTLWTNSQFCGMPTYLITMPDSTNVLVRIQTFFGKILAEGVMFVFVYMIGAYILLISLNCNKWISVIGAIMFGFASYNMIIIAAGHWSKVYVIAYMVPLVGSVWLSFKSLYKGLLLTLIFASLAIANNHVQILYYALFLLVALCIVEFIYAKKESRLKNFFKTMGGLSLVAILSLGMNITALATTYEYSKETMRGGSNISLNKENVSSDKGLDKDYITQWSYGIDETLTILIPNFKGGASGLCLSADSETANELKRMGIPNYKNVIKDMRLPLYWGTQPFTSGPVYFGAIVCFLFVVGLFLVEKKTLVWLLPVAVLMLMLSWGHNFMPLTDFFIDYVPMYNKFRTVSMTLVITWFCITLIAVLGLVRFFEKDADKEKNFKALYIGLGLTGGICLIFYLFPSLAGSFINASEDSRLTGSYEFLQKTLPIDRKDMLSSDALRSLIFILLSGGMLYLYNKSKNLNPKCIYLMLAVLVLCDLYPVAKRYFNDENYVKDKRIRTFKPTFADEFILKDKSYCRTLDATVNIFNDAKPGYFHKNIGGYHAAKLSRYQDIIDIHLSQNIPALFNELNKARTIADRDSVFERFNVLNMLNMKYLIYNHQTEPIVNNRANGNAWFVSDIKLVEDANQEILSLNEVNTKNTIVMDKAFNSQVIDLKNRDTSASISLVNYAPNSLKYEYNSKTDQIAVFSEIYYDKGWNVYVDNEKADYFRADYLLRAMNLKAGSHTIEFRFEPSTYHISKTINIVCSVIFIVLCIVYIYLRCNNKIAEE